MMDPGLAFVFPGQGSQSVGMLAALAQRHAWVRDTFDEASHGAGVDLWKLAQEGPEAELNRTEFTQPALLAAGIAVWRSWQHVEEAVMPARLAGHSLGEYTALVAAEALSLVDAAKLVRRRGQLMQQAVPEGAGAMAAVLNADADTVEAACRDAAQGEVVSAANFNSPGQIVIGGDAAAVDRALALLAERGVRKAVKLAVSVPSHTAKMRDAAERLREAIADAHWRAPTVPVVHNVDADTHVSVEDIHEALVRQLASPVRWDACVARLRADGIERMAECGPGKVLTGLARRIDKGIDARALGEPDDFDAARDAWRLA